MGPKKNETSSQLVFNFALCSTFVLALVQQHAHPDSQMWVKKKSNFQGGEGFSSLSSRILCPWRLLSCLVSAATLPNMKVYYKNPFLKIELVCLSYIFFCSVFCICQWRFCQFFIPRLGELFWVAKREKNMTISSVMHRVNQLLGTSNIFVEKRSLRVDFVGSLLGSKNLSLFWVLLRPFETFVIYLDFFESFGHFRVFLSLF